MAYFAKLDENNIVIEVHTVANAALDMDNEEASGIAFLTEWSGGHTNWVQTSYNTMGGVHTQGGTPLRYNYAGIGFTYDPIDDAFISPAPCDHPELTLSDKKQWECANADHVLVIPGQ